MELKPPRESVLDRFLRYVRIHTTSDPESTSCPSTECQWDLLRMLHDELVELGAHDVTIDDNGYVFATVPATVDDSTAERVPTIGFIAHVDTVPGVRGDGVRPIVHPDYQGGDIALPGDPSQVIHPSDYPNLESRYIGMDIVTSDGTTLLGADDKAGVAEVMTAVDVLLRNPQVPHGTIRVGFTPDEEIGRGADRFDVARFGAQFAYTLDGGPLGEIEFETFNAYSARLDIVGVAAHPGYARDKLVNAIRIAGDFIARLPRDMSPERTEGREGYIHPVGISGQSEKATVRLILRDFEMAGIERQQAILRDIVEQLRGEYPRARIDLALTESYRNMREVIEKEPRLVEFAEEAIRRAGVEPRHQLVRGGTDGARLSFMGLPCPNLFDGGEGIHSEREWVPVQVMEKAVETVVHLAAIWAERTQNG